MRNLWFLHYVCKMNITMRRSLFSFAPVSFTMFSLCSFTSRGRGRRRRRRRRRRPRPRRRGRGRRPAGRWCGSRAAGGSSAPACTWVTSGWESYGQNQLQQFSSRPADKKLISIETKIANKQWNFLRHSFKIMQAIFLFCSYCLKKSRIRETLNLLMFVDSSTERKKKK